LATVDSLAGGGSGTSNGYCRQNEEIDVTYIMYCILVTCRPNLKTVVIDADIQPVNLKIFKKIALP